MELKSFFVSWYIDIDATSEIEAAKLARAIQLDPLSEATVFSVEEEDSEVVVEIDLTEISHG